MHALRHTYAMRAIERGVQLKILQQLLGHASIQTMMDRYVHVTDDSLVNAVRQFENAAPVSCEKRKYEERQKPREIKGFWIGVRENEIRNRRSAQRGQKHTF